MRLMTRQPLWRYGPWIGLALLLGACAASPSQRADTAESLPPVTLSVETLGPGDEIEVKVYRHDDLTRKTKIPSSGVIVLPLIGEIKAAGQGAEPLRQQITQAYDKYIVNPQVMLDITSQRSSKLVILGEVRQPGVFYIDRPTSAIDGVSLAGGFTRDAKSKEVLLLRKGGDKAAHYKLDLASALNASDLNQNIALQAGDILYVPPSTAANVDRFFAHVENILRPLLFVEQAIVVGHQAQGILLHGDAPGSTTSVIISP